jgi:hypothetical protein
MGFVFLIIGLIFGIFMTKQMPKIIDYLNRDKSLRFKVRFHIYYVIHKQHSETNEIINTDSIEISVIAKNETDASNLVTEMITNELKIEIESVERSTL